MSALSEQAVRERGLLVQGISVQGTINVDVDGYVTRTWEFLHAKCSHCDASLYGSVSKIAEHYAEHAEERAMENIRVRNRRKVKHQRHRHDYTDADICSGCDMLRPKGKR